MQLWWQIYCESVGPQTPCDSGKKYFHKQFHAESAEHILHWTEAGSMAILAWYNLRQTLLSQSLAKTSASVAIRNIKTITTLEKRNYEAEQSQGKTYLANG